MWQVAQVGAVKSWPTVQGTAEIPLLLLRVVNVAVFAGRVDLVDRHVGADVTLLARVRFAGNLEGERVPRVAGGTGAPRAVQIDAAHPLIGPAGEDGEVHLPEVSVPGLGSGDLEPGAVAVETAEGLGRGVGGTEDQSVFLENRVAKNVPLEILVEGVAFEVAVSVGHDISGVLIRLHRVADRAVAGADD
jgi:hypothetical protein